MNWEQMFAAINALAPASLMMRKPGDWYVSHIGVEVKRGRILGGVSGNGQTPEAAVLDHWAQLLNIEPLHYLVVNAMGPKRTAARWNGFMWQAVNEELRA